MNNIIKLKKTKFTFWKNNRIDGFYVLTEKELVEKFKQFIHSEDRRWVAESHIYELMNKFIGGYLSSVGDNKETERILDLIVPIRGADNFNEPLKK
jgi:hypothetical protein